MYGRRDCTTIDKVVEMAQKEMAAIRNIEDVSFRDFFASRIVGTKATTATRYAAKVAIKIALMPVYYGAYKVSQITSSPDNGI